MGGEGEKGGGGEKGGEGEEGRRGEKGGGGEEGGDGGRRGEGGRGGEGPCAPPPPPAPPAMAHHHHLPRLPPRLPTPSAAPPPAPAAVRPPCPPWPRRSVPRGGRGPLGRALASSGALPAAVPVLALHDASRTPCAASVEWGAAGRSGWAGCSRGWTCRRTCSRSWWTSCARSRWCACGPSAGPGGPPCTACPSRWTCRPGGPAEHVLRLLAAHSLLCWTARLRLSVSKAISVHFGGAPLEVLSSSGHGVLLR